ncbi:MAG: S8 family serine peptidase [Deltaproteobacteria bacterium]|nr:S8 family serine peptidase [Deltaproteobacteria bacterium]
MSRLIMPLCLPAFCALSLCLLAPREAHAEAYWITLARTDNARTDQEAHRPLADAHVEAIIATGARLRTRSRWLHALSVNATTDELESIARLPFVAAIRPVGRGMRPLPKASPLETPPLKLFANENDYGQAWAQLAALGVPAMHDCGLRGEGVTIAILDTGFNLAHQALANVSVTAAHDFVNDDDIVRNESGDPSNQHDHGSLVLALLAGMDAGNFMGVAPKASYLLAKVDDVAEDTPIEDDWWVAGLEWAEREGANVVSSSISFCTSPCDSSQMNGQTEATSKAAAIAASKGLWLFNSAGNTGPGVTTIRAPGDAEGVFAVGAVDLAGTIAGNSSRGPTADGRTKPDLVGPGVNVLSIDSTSESSYRRYTGTSVATPLVAGVAGLLRQAYPQMSTAELQGLLRIHASQADAPDNTFGSGLPAGALSTAEYCTASPSDGGAVVDGGTLAKDGGTVEDDGGAGQRDSGSDGATPAESSGCQLAAARLGRGGLLPWFLMLVFAARRRWLRNSVI